MLIYLAKRRGQSILEYAVLIGVVVAGLLGMQIYLKRGMMGGLKKSADGIGSQFDPKATVFTSNSHSSSNSTEVLSSEGVTTTTVHLQTSNHEGSENVSEIGNQSLF